MKWCSLLVLGAVTSLWASAGVSTDWKINPQKSRLGFTATFEGAEFDGVFKDFDGNIRFDPDALHDSAFDVSVDVTSADTGSSDLNEGMALPEWFHFSRYPRATFTSSSIERETNTGYEAVGLLEIKGVRKTVRLPFRWQRAGDEARISGDAILKRTQFNLGDGEWADVNILGDSVRVWVDLNLVRVP
ncbi:MAG: hypothetical protein GTO41_05310 [Burkholderiales bacterium]|nr:hypothetical protein [Burkholderiales bacterium]